MDDASFKLGKVQNLRDGGQHITGILINLANHLIYASFLHNILFGPTKESKNIDGPISSP